MRAAWLILAVACGGSTAGVGTSAAPPASQVEAPRVAITTAIIPQLTLTLRNDTDTDVTIDRSFGPATPFRLVRLDGGLPDGATFDDVDDDKSGGWIKTCVCTCGSGPCALCEPPASVHITLRPGEAYTSPTTGMLRHWTDEGCAQRMSPPQGRYIVTACSTAERCGRIEVALPREEPVEILLSQSGSVKTCEEVPSERLGLWVRRLVAASSLGETCPSTPTCVTSRDQVKDTKSCGSWVVPSDDRLELWLTAAGKRKVDWLDADATRTLSGRNDR